MHGCVLHCRSVGTFAMVLQQLVSSGQLRVSDCLLDDNNIVLKVHLYVI